MKKERVWIYSFLVIMILPIILNLVVTPTSENVENRTLEALPVLSIETLDEFPMHFESYYNDHFPFRTQLVKLNSMITYYSFHDSPSSNVIIGRDRWLFLKQDQIDTYKKINLLNEDEKDWMIENITKTEKYMNSRGIEFIIYIAPDKATIYNDKLPSYIRNSNEISRTDQIIQIIQDNTNIKVIYPKEELLKARKDYPQYQFYYPQDTHWNELGGYVGAQALLSEMDITLPNLSTLKITQNNQARRGLSNMIGIPDMQGGGYGYSVAGYDNVITKIEKVPDDNNTRYFAISGNDKKIMIIRDSFVEAMEQYIAPQYSETYLPHMDLYYSADMIDTEKPDIVVAEFVERNANAIAWYRFIPE